jgi:hypothetical protein
MTEGTWIYIPERPEGGEPWTGRIWSEGKRSRRWNFEIIRHAELKDIYACGVFDSAKPVSVLLDHQRPATLIRPLVLQVDPGKVGTTHPFPRTRLEGSFQALLSGLAIEDEQVPQFAGLGFESEAFAAWYGGRPFSATTGDGFRTKSIEVADPEKEIVNIEGLGQVEATRLAHVRADHSTSEVRTRSILRITFDRLRSLPEAMDLCLGLELVFGFLVGFRPKWPTFHLWLQARGDNENVSTMRNAELELGGVYFRDAPAPHPMERVHRCQQGGTDLRQVLEAYAAAPIDIVTRIHAVQVGRWFGASLNDKFAAVMPVFEQYVQATFKSEEEVSFLALERTFFAYVDAATDSALIEFSKKHLQVRDRKSPSLPTLIGRAIDSVNSEGFRFDPGLAKRISDRRATMFHSAPLMTEADVHSFYEETQAVTALLLLRTLDELGVKIAPLSKDHHAITEFSNFMHGGPAAG